jgi:membrane protein DedA with SNARE-associated domain
LILQELEHLVATYGYLIGRLVGHRVIERLGPYVGATPPLVEKFRGLFFRDGPAIVIVARLIEVLRQMNGILAGSMGMPWWRFVVCNMIGAASRFCLPVNTPVQE